MRDRLDTHEAGREKREERGEKRADVREDTDEMRGKGHARDEWHDAIQ